MAWRWRTAALAAAALAGSGGGAAVVWRSGSALAATEPAVDLNTALPTPAATPAAIPAAIPASVPASVPASKPAAEPTSTPRRPRLVVLGSGWAAVGLLKTLPKDLYDVTVVSDRNYFLFTPLLPSVTVGALDTAAVVESMHIVCRRSNARFALASAIDIDVKAQTVTVMDSSKQTGALPYDILVVAIGARSITWGVPGVEENCFFLKTVSDAQAIRQRVLEQFERAALPHYTDDERRKMLSFVIVGGGPTVLSDFLHEDLSYAFPDLVKQFANVTIVQSADHILNTYAADISKFAESRFLDDKINLLVNARVQKVEPGAITVTVKGIKEPQKVHFGLCVWSTGVGPQPLAQRMMTQLDQQTNTRAIVTDDRLLVKGLHNVFALGDCATIELPRLLQSAVDIFAAADTNHDGSLDVSEFEELSMRISKKHPQLREHMASARKLFAEHDVNHDGSLSPEEFAAMLHKVDAKLTALPSTAQVASQQGVYLAKLLRALAPSVTAGALAAPLKDIVAVQAPFVYRHLGSMAYVGGNKAVLEVTEGKWSGGLGAFFLWRSAYLSRQVSTNTRINLMLEWAKRPFVGRNISKY